MKKSIIVKNNCGTNYKWLNNLGFWYNPPSQKKKKKKKGFIILFNWFFYFVSMILLKCSGGFICLYFIFLILYSSWNKKRLNIIHDYCLKLMKYFEWHEGVSSLLNKMKTYYYLQGLFKINLALWITNTRKNQKSVRKKYRGNFQQK